jgi:WD40 repeat protein
MLGLWDTRTGKQIYQWVGQSGIQTLAFSPDGKKVAAAGEMNRIYIWDLATRRDLHPDRGHDESAVWAVFSPDGKTVASTSHDRTIRFWEAATGRQIKRLNTGDQPINRIAYSADGKILAGSWFFDAFRQWSAETGL